MFKKYIFVMASLLFMNSCYNLNTDIQINSVQYPESYNDDVDTSNIADINWKDFFADSTLINLIDIALINNFDLLMAIQKIEIARSYAKITESDLFPKSSVVLQSGLDKYGRYTMDGAGNQGSEITPGKNIPRNLPDIYIGLQSSWEIDIWNKIRNQQRAAFSSFLATIEEINFIKTQLIYEVANSYYELLSLDNELKIIQNTINSQIEALEIIRNIKESGRTTELALQQFSAQLLYTKGLEKSVKQSIYELENKINFLLGRIPQQIERYTEQLFEETSEQIIGGIPPQLLQNRPDIREAELLVQSSKFDLIAAKKAFYPTLNLTANIGFQAFDPSYLFLSPASIAYSILGGLVAPVINIYDLKAKFQNATALQIQALYNYQKILLNAYVEVVNELSNIKYLDELMLLKEQENNAFKKSVETSLELFKAAKANYLDVLISQQSVFNSNLELVIISQKKRMSTVNLYKSLGGGW